MSELTPDLVESCLAPDDPRPDRRRGERRAPPRPLHCLISTDGDAPEAAVLLEASRWGAGLAVYRPVRLGDPVAVSVGEAGRGRPAAELAGWAAHCGELEPGRYALGVEFVWPLEETELEALLTRTQGPPGGGGPPRSAADS